MGWNDLWLLRNIHRIARGGVTDSAPLGPNRVKERKLLHGFRRTSDSCIGRRCYVIIHSKIGSLNIFVTRYGFAKIFNAAFYHNIHKYESIYQNHECCRLLSSDLLSDNVKLFRRMN